MPPCHCSSGSRAGWRQLARPSSLSSSQVRSCLLSSNDHPLRHVRDDDMKCVCISACCSYVRRLASSLSNAPAMIHNRRPPFSCLLRQRLIILLPILGLQISQRGVDWVHRANCGNAADVCVDVAGVSPAAPLFILSFLSMGLWPGDIAAHMRSNPLTSYAPVFVSDC